MPPDAEGPQPGKSAAQDDENLPKVKKQKNTNPPRFPASNDPKPFSIFLRNNNRFKPLVHSIFMVF